MKKDNQKAGKKSSPEYEFREECVIGNIRMFIQEILDDASQSLWQDRYELRLLVGRLLEVHQ